MVDLLQQDQPLVGPAPLQADEERGHLGLPPPVDLGPGHGGQRGLQVVGLDVADQEPVVVQEQAVSCASRCRPGPGASPARPARAGGGTRPCGQGGRAAGNSTVGSWQIASRGGRTHKLGSQFGGPDRWN
jgi:hypothetical protein